jgi:hypothetical protein
VGRIGRLVGTVFAFGGSPELPEPSGGGSGLFQVRGVARAGEGIRVGAGEAGGKLGGLPPELPVVLSGEDEDGEGQAGEERRGQGEGALAVAGKGTGPALGFGVFLAAAACPQGGRIVFPEGAENGLGVPGPEKAGERLGAELIDPEGVPLAASGPRVGVEEFRPDSDEDGGGEASRVADQQVEEEASAEGVPDRVEARGEGGEQVAGPGIRCERVGRVVGADPVAG